MKRRVPVNDISHLVRKRVSIGRKRVSIGRERVSVWVGGVA